MNVDVKDLVVDFSGVLALDGVSCSFRPGVVNGLIGPNGAGKSTLLNAMTGVVSPTSGRIEMAGRETTSAKPEVIRGYGVTRTFQIPMLHEDLSVLDNLALGLPRPRLGIRPFLPWHASPATRDRRNAARDSLSRLGSPELESMKVRDLSLPEQRIAELARALISGPDLVMLDEPSSGLGIAESEEILAKGRELLDEDATMIVVSHDVELVFGMAEWMVVMAEGHVLAQGEPDAIRADNRVIEAYLGETDG